MAYMTTRDLVKQYLGIPDGTSSENTPIDNAIAAAESEIESICGRTFEVPSSATAKTFIPFDDFTVYCDDIAQKTGLIVKCDDDMNGSYETTLTITTDYVLNGNTAP